MDQEFYFLMFDTAMQCQSSWLIDCMVNRTLSEQLNRTIVNQTSYNEYIELAKAFQILQERARTICLCSSHEKQYMG